ncbi:helix-turn-helix transcriptional regulator [Shewanella sp. D64]|uniref:winged helix-turn-helix transcriptional regulator n=1 Tax=unclassified Shewanella TaxID=196818 RepID=UPI0022BA713B|nr:MULTISPECIES: helix-turn-helix domain-containing protein [unclassified Shewanella]MEC4726992.1 helix-turn-helix transcriptional regulator [Shewanella sp. D64]MEC4738511.1 helix-turn-helix transcriptional regulator [Shewanella sp. E94]WBJ93731.1 helix-turn-helix transcriptional regulator [Shewanella sp. MTB7]
MTLKEKEIANFQQRVVGPSDSARMVETIVGCKWSLTVYELLALDINRPGEMVRSVDGLTTKVLNQCLKRNLEFGILEKCSFPEIPPRVEYKVTPFGMKFMTILDALKDLQKEIQGDK